MGGIANGAGFAGFFGLTAEARAVLAGVAGTGTALSGSPFKTQEPA